MGFKKFKSKNVFLSMILCSVASFSLLHADNLKECESEEDKKAGCVVKEYYDNGNLKAETPYRNGKAEGVGKFYKENGNLELEIPYKNGQMEGTSKIYYPNGDIFAEKPFKNDKVNGIVKVYYEGKKLIWQANAQNGKLVSGKCSSGKAFTSAHLTRLTNEINEGKWGRYWYDICEK